MKRIALISAIAISALMLVLPCYAFPVDGITVDRAEIDISGNDVSEHLLFSSSSVYNGTLELWIPSDKYEVEYMGNELAGTMQDSVLSINLSEQGIVIPAGKNISLNVSYSIGNIFDYRVMYPTDEMVITIHSGNYLRGSIPVRYDGNGIYTSDIASLQKGDSISIEFAAEKEKVSISVIAGAVAVVFAILIIAYILKRRGADGMLGKESVEALELRKRLLTDALKTLEVEHEKKKIPDAYYRSIKEYFKKEAIRVLRELDRRE